MGKSRLIGKNKVKNVSTGKHSYTTTMMVEAVEVSRKEYYETRGWELSPDENPNERLMMVTYDDGHILGLPKDKFHAVCVECDNGCCTFGHAINECRYYGKRIKRFGWNGEDQFVEFRSVEIPYSEESTVKQSHAFVFHFKNRKTGETGIQVGWLASQADMAANDWVVME